MVAKQAGSAYTRAGDFSFDADGRLVSSDGDAVQGWNAQRGFQASSRTITVSDELLLETLNLKR